MKNYNGNKIFHKIIFSLTIFLLVIPSINGSIINENNSYSSSKHFSINPIGVQHFYINASTPYEYGYKVGKIIGPLIITLRLLLPFIDHYDENIIKTYAKNQTIYLKKYFPFELKELEGLSDSLNINIDRVLYLKKIFNSYCSDQCTVTLSTGNATKYNQTFLTQNIDLQLPNASSFIRLLLMSRFHSYNLWIVKINTMKYKYAFFGIPLFRERTVLNEKGLAHGGNGIRFTSDPDKPIDEGEGLSLVSLRRLTMMICSNVTDAVNLWKKYPRESTRKDGIMTVVYCDNEGKIVVIESTHSYFVAIYRNSTDMTNSYEDILWHTNHFQWLDANLTGSIQPEEYPGSVLRYERSKQLLEKNYGNITIETCKELCRDHGGGFVLSRKDSGDICAHPDTNSFDITSYSYIVLPDSLTIYYTHGPPCKSKYICRNLTIPLTKEYPLLDYILY